MHHGYPQAADGQIVGLLGGSFDPPHRGHVHITLEALRRFGLDRIWWMVSPGNPLKADAPAAMERRLAACRQIMRHPRVEVTDVEARLGTRFTAETLLKLRRAYPRVTFVWLMGADNLASFHRWDAWRDIMETVPIGVLARPGEQLRAGLSPAARVYREARLPARQAGALPDGSAPRWTLIAGPMVAQSSTALREAGVWTR